MKSRIQNKIKAGFGILAINSPEETRILGMLKEIATECDMGICVWSVTAGIVDLETGQQIQGTEDPIEFLKHINLCDKDCIFAALDTNFLMEDPLFVRSIKDGVKDFESGKPLVFISVYNNIPTDLSHLVTTIDSELPCRNKLQDVVEDICESAEKNIPEDLDKVLDALAGLTTDNAANILAESIVETGSVNAEVISREKCAQLSSRDYLKVETIIPTEGEIGGMDVLKQWLNQRVKMFSKEAKEFGLPTPKGFLQVGIPGCGKSLASKAVASILQIPLIRFDIGAVMGGIVGESEKNIRDAIAIAEAMSPCVLWIDELDKQMSPQGGSSDGSHEVTKRVMSSILTWLQEKTKPVFVVATANNIQGLTSSFPELLRKGRWDEIFFVDLPNKKERENIFKIHLAKMKRIPGAFLYGEMAYSTEGFSGAEIEAAVKDGMFISFSKNEELTNESIFEAIEATVTQSSLAKQSINSLQEWAKGRARPASSPVEVNKKRKIKI